MNLKNLLKVRGKKELTLSERGRSFPSFFQSTVGVGAPDIGTSIFSGSPALTRISLPPRADRSTFGGAVLIDKIIQNSNFNQRPTFFNIEKTTSKV